LGVVAGGTTHHALVQQVSTQVRHFVVGATNFEGKHRLRIFTFE
jgi:hypothetical protein